RTGGFSSGSAEPPCVARWSIAAAFQQASDHSAPSSTHHGTFLIEPPGPVGNDICARSFRESGWQLEWGRSHVGRREDGPCHGIFVSSFWIRAEACCFWFPCCAVLSAANLHGRNCRRVHSRCPPRRSCAKCFEMCSCSTYFTIARPLQTYTSVSSLPQFVRIIKLTSTTSISILVSLSRNIFQFRRKGLPLARACRANPSRPILLGFGVP